MIARAEDRQRHSAAPCFLTNHRFNKAQQDALLPAVEAGLTDQGDHGEPLLLESIRS